MSSSQDMSRPLSSRIRKEASLETTLARTEIAPAAKNCPVNKYTTGGQCFAPPRRPVWSSTQFRSGNSYVSFSKSS